MEVSFFIHRNGSISDLQFVKRSGSFTYDIEAQGIAVEEAGKVFGPVAPLAGSRTCCSFASSSAQEGNEGERAGSRGRVAWRCWHSPLLPPARLPAWPQDSVRRRPRCTDRDHVSTRGAARYGHAT
jgi:hypothetical protein